MIQRHRWRLLPLKSLNTFSKMPRVYFVHFTARLFICLEVNIKEMEIECFHRFIWFILLLGCEKIHVPENMTVKCYDGDLVGSICEYSCINMDIVGPTNVMCGKCKLSFDWLEQQGVEVHFIFCSMMTFFSFVLECC